MCGRINVSDNEGVRLLLSMLGMETWPSREPRFNIAPTQTLDVVQWNDQPTLTSMKWGLLPPWAKPGQFSSPLINARSETIRTKPSFRQLIATQRVLIPINGFYEWLREGKSKTPFYVSPKEHAAMFVAGIYQQPTGENDDGSKKKPEVCVVTTEANSAMAIVHHRMPVILPIASALSWIDNSDRDTIDELMKPASNQTLGIKRVGSYVNSSRNEGPQCTEPEQIDDLFG
jgi:putative SOS response-associated peptidase YedK